MSSAPVPQTAVTSQDGGEEQHLQSELAEVRYIFETLYPGRPLETHLWWDHSPVPTPDILGPDAGTSPEHLGLSFLGVKLLGDKNGTLEGKRLHITIPKRPTPGELQDHYTAWMQRPRLYRNIFKLSPTLFEHGKYRVERRQAEECTQRHGFLKLKLSRNIRFDALSEQMPATKAPAILIGFHWLEVGGAENLAFDTVNWALKAGLRVFVIADRSGAQRAAHKLPDHPDLHFLRTDRYLPRHLYPAFLRQLALRENIVATHNHHCTILYECLPSLKAHFPDMLHMDSTHITEYADAGYPRISGVWTNYIDVHHVISDDLKAFYERHFKVGSKVKVGRLLSPEVRKSTPLEPRIGVNRSFCRVAFVGRMVHQKRPILAIEIMQRLMRWGQGQGIEFAFEVVGEGPYLEVIEHMLRRYRMSHVTNVHAAGTDVPALLAKSDVVLMPSANEGLALVCYEAIGEGCVPVTTDVGAQSEIVPKAALVDRAPFRTVSQSVDVVQRLLTDDQFRSDVCEEMRAKFDKLRNDTLAEELLMPIYQELAQPAKDQMAAE